MFICKGVCSSPGIEADVCPTSTPKENVDQNVERVRRLCLQFGTGEEARIVLEGVAEDYDIILADVLPGRIRHLQSTQRWASSDHNDPLSIPIIDAVFANSKRCIEYMTWCDLITTTVGPRILPRLAPTILTGILARKREANFSPLHIVCCEDSLQGGVVAPTRAQSCGLESETADVLQISTKATPSCEQQNARSLSPNAVGSSTLLRGLVMQLAARDCPESCDWIPKHVTYVDVLVDRARGQVLLTNRVTQLPPLMTNMSLI